MKLTNPESIQESEKEFIDTINAELDWDAIEQMLLEKHGFEVQEEVLYKDGNLVVHENQIAYKFDFEIKVPLSVIFNRDGECIDISTRHDEEGDADLYPEMDDPAETDGREADESLPDNPEKQTSGMASEIADMISEINEQGD